MIGETIKDFKLIARLGKGGMGEVWAAEQQIIKTKVAIKLLLADISTDKQHVQRFFNEAIAVSKIRHAGIVRIYDVGFHDQRAYLIMEMLEGETLSSRIARGGRMPISAVADFGRQAASVLEATHAAGITHRDLKPDNIFLVPDAELASRERVKILDFGIAKLTTGATGATGMTATGGSMGTPAYMAPEQWNDAAKADARADVYSLGCLVFEMCCGRPPFVVTSVGEACTKHLTETPVRVRTLVPDVPAELDALIARMLAKAPADRPTMREIGGVFAALATSRPAGLDATLAPAHSAAPRSAPDTTLGSAAGSALRQAAPARSRTRLVGALVALACVSVAGVVYVYVTTHAGHDAAAPPPPPMPAHVAALAPTPAPPRADDANPWVAIDPPAVPVALGLEDDHARDELRGFRPARKIVSPSAPYALQAHEVTWAELDPWLAARTAPIDYPPWATDAHARAQLPASGITWSTALAYCQSIGGALPTEEQWEYAARGADRRPNAWGADRLDRGLTHAYAGASGVPTAVKTSMQDQTPANADGQRVYDLIGNVQEWTAGLWREDKPSADESWVQAGETTIRAIRGLPLASPPPPSIQIDSAAYREQLCATGPCVEKGRRLRAYVGFRCAKAIERSR